MELKFTFRGYQKSCKEFCEMIHSTIKEHDDGGLYCNSIVIKSCGIEDRDKELMATLKEFSPILASMATMTNTF